MRCSRRISADSRLSTESIEESSRLRGSEKSDASSLEVSCALSLRTSSHGRPVGTESGPGTCTSSGSSEVIVPKSHSLLPPLLRTSLRTATWPPTGTPFTARRWLSTLAMRSSSVSSSVSAAPFGSSASSTPTACDAFITSSITADSAKPVRRKSKKFEKP